jgi:signal transduction histidine kinase
MGMTLLERVWFLESEMKTIISSVKLGVSETFHQKEAESGERLRHRFSALAVVTGTGKGDQQIILGHYNDLPPLTKAEKEHLSAGKTVLTSHLNPDQQMHIYMSRLLDPRRAERGLLLGEINPEYLWGTADVNPLPLMTEFFVLDRSGNMLFSSFEVAISFPEDVIPRMTTTKMGEFEWNHGGTNYIARYRSFNLKFNFYEPKWIVVLSESKGHVLAPMAKFKRIFPLVVLLSLWIVVLLSVIHIRRSLVPIEILQEGTNKVANGEYGHRVEIRSGDEFETLGKSFNEMSAKIKESQAQLIQSAKMSAVGQMASAIVHEVKQPISAIDGNIQLWLMEEESEGVRDRVGNLQNSVKRLIEILLKFGVFTRRSDEDMHEVSLNQVLDEVVKLLEHQMIIKRVELVIKKEENLPPILGNSNNIHQVFINLIMNSVDALEDREGTSGLIGIKTYSTDSQICVELEDNGPGIPKNIQRKIFDPFYTTKKAGKGTGLGLSIIQTILDNHHATIRLESEEGTGTKFIVSFPALSDV